MSEIFETSTDESNEQYVYASEIMPLRYRHLGFALSVSCQWVMAFITVFAGPIAIANPSVGWKTWIWFLVFNALAVPFGESRRLSIPPECKIDGR